MVLRLFLALLLLVPGVAIAGGTATADSLDRLSEVLRLRVEDGRLRPEDVMPAILVSARPWSAETESWYSTRVIEVLSLPDRRGPAAQAVCAYREIDAPQIDCGAARS